MRTAIGISGAPYGASREAWEQTVDFICDAERLGVDDAWSAEAWGQDAVTPLAYLAARTSKIRLGTGIMQISARVPVMTAMTALTMAYLTENRFALGLGTSGPQVVEGLHGVPFAKAYTRLRETIEIIRLGLRGEPIVYQGTAYELPRPGGEGKALRLAHQPNPDLPIYLATLAPRSLKMTGELTDGWLGTSFIPEQGQHVIDVIAEGAASAGRSLSDIDLQVGGAVEFSDDVESLVPPRKAHLAFSMGAMGSGQTNFYNAAFRRAGYEELAAEVQRLWLSGERDAARELIPDDMVLHTNLLGTDDMVRDRLRAYRDIGVTTLRIAPAGETARNRLDTLARVIDLIRDVDTERAAV